MLATAPPDSEDAGGIDRQFEHNPDWSGDWSGWFTPGRYKAWRAISAPNGAGQQDHGDGQDGTNDALARQVPADQPDPDQTGQFHHELTNITDTDR